MSSLRAIIIENWRVLNVSSSENWDECEAETYNSDEGTSGATSAMAVLSVDSRENWDECEASTKNPITTPTLYVSSSENWDECEVSANNPVTTAVLNVSSSENWDDCEVGTYNPMAAVADKQLLLKPPTCKNKRRKREFYLRERERHARLNKNPQ